MLIVTCRLFSIIAFFLSFAGTFPVAGLVEAASISNASPSYYLTAVASSDGKKLIGVGERGIITLSEDGGSTWHIAENAGQDTLTDVVFTDADKVWVVGHAGTLLSSVDAGGSWKTVLQGSKVSELALAEAQRIKDTAVSDEQHQLAANLQANAQRMIESGSSEPLFSLLFTDELHGYAVGAYGVVLRTDDGGHTWKAWLGHVDNPQKLHIYAIAQAQGGIYLVGEQGFIARSTNDGDHFSRLETDFSGSFFTIAAAADKSLYVAGLEGVVIRSTDNGSTWAAVEVATKQSWVASEAMPDGSVILANANGGFFRSVTGHKFSTLSVSQDDGLCGFKTLSNGTVITAGPRGISTKSLNLSGSASTEVNQ
ncbi:WD40/YVTN/BNR-like repeat-containing protein [Pseudomonas sp. IT-P100]|uniref:WD40/YVTN/BNR-like repeat-containing protein n=1 Tax=Pseudomonas sp. IT-P100 TaxID=3026452 RepID=UPI0039E11851